MSVTLTLALYPHLGGYILAREGHNRLQLPYVPSCRAPDLERYPDRGSLFSVYVHGARLL